VERALQLVSKGEIDINEWSIREKKATRARQIQSKYTQFSNDDWGASVTSYVATATEKLSEKRWRSIFFKARSDDIVTYEEAEDSAGRSLAAVSKDDPRASMRV